MFVTMGGTTRTLFQKKGNKKKRRTTIVEEEIAPLYKEDLGMKGVKRLRTDPVASVAPLPLTKQEKKRRKERKVS